MAVAGGELRLRTLWRSRMVRPMRPDKVLRTLGVMRRWGLTPAAAYGVLAIRDPDRSAIVDEQGILTFAEVDRRTNALADGLRTLGLREPCTVAIMCANHRGFVDATVACSKLGANVLYLHTGFTAARVADLLARAEPDALIYDEEFSELMPQPDGRCTHLIARGEASVRPSRSSLEQLIAAGDPRPPSSPRGAGAVAVLATGPGGSQRTVPSSLVLPKVLFSPMPLKSCEATVLAAPMCEPWGFLHLKLGLRLGSTLVLNRGFDPRAALSEVAQQHASAIALTPEMLRAIVDLGTHAIASYDTASLGLIAVNGSSLPQDLAIPAMRMFGEVLYNLHGTVVVNLNGQWARRERRRPTTAPTRVRSAHTPPRLLLDGHARRPA